MSQKHLSKIEKSTNKNYKRNEPPEITVSTAFLNQSKILYTTELEFKIGHLDFIEQFMVFENLSGILLGLPFFDKYKIKIDVHNRLLQSPEFSFQLNTMQTVGSSTPKRLHHKTKIYLKTMEDIKISPGNQTILKLQPDNEITVESQIGIVEPTIKFEKLGLCLTSSIDKLQKNEPLFMIAINSTEVPIHIRKNSSVATFSVLTPEQARYLIPLEPKLIQSENEKRNTKQISKSIEKTARGEINHITIQSDSEFWFPTPENVEDPSRLAGLEKRIYDELISFRKLETIRPAENGEDRKTFLRSFKWDGCVLSDKDKKRTEQLLVKFNDIFTRHRLDIGYTSKFSVKLTPDSDRPVYSKAQRISIHLKDDLLVELALLQYYGVITTLPFSRYSSPIFAKRKPNGKLRILIDLRKINHLIRNDYNNNNFPIATLTDAGAHLAGKKIFCKMDGSHGYYSVPMADDQSVQLLAFNFASRTYAFQRLAQGLSRSVSAFSSFMRQNLDPVITADKCFQYVDDIGIGAYDTEDMLEKLEAVFKCIRESGMKLATDKCAFGLAEIQFLGNTITSEGLTPIRQKITTFLNSFKMPKTVKQIKRMIGFFMFYKAFIPELADKLLPFYKLLKKDSDLKTTEEHKIMLEKLTNDLQTACEMSLKLPKTNKQYVIMTDASFYAAGFVLMIEDYTDKKHDQNAETKPYAPVSFGSRIFQPNQLKMSIYAKEFLAVHFALDTFGNLIWGCEKPVLILTDNQAVTRFFQTKIIPPSLWNALDHVLSFEIILGHIPGKANMAADYLSRIHINPKEKLELRIKAKLPMHEVQVDQSSDAPDNSLNWIYCHEDTEQKHKKSYLTEKITRKELEPLSAEVHLQKFPTNASFNALHEHNPLDDFETTGHAPINLIAEQQKDGDIKKVMLWFEQGPPSTGQYLSTDLKKYLKQYPRLAIIDGVLRRKFFNQTGKEFIPQYCVPQHLQKEILYRIHNSVWGGHRGVSRTIIEFRKRFYFPNFTEVLTEYINNCLTCVQSKPTPTASLKPPLQPMSSLYNFPTDVLLIDLVGKMHPTPYTFILSAIDVFSKYLFAVPLLKGDADLVARTLVSIFLRHSYIPSTIICDLGTAFTSHLMSELAQLLEVQLKHCTLKHAQTIGLLERNHAPLKQILRINENQTSSDWHRYVDIAVFIHNTTFAPAIGCTPSDVFHGRTPTNPLDLRFQNTTLWKQKSKTECVKELQDKTTELLSSVKDSLISSYLKYKKYYDRKANASPLALHSYCLILDPKCTTQIATMNKQQSRWIPMYRVEKILTNANYIVRKTNTQFTQCVHRMRLRPIKPQHEVEDLDSINPNDFEADPSVPEHEREPQLFDNQVRQHIQQQDMNLPRTVPEYREVTFNDNIQTGTFEDVQPASNHQQIEQTQIYDENTFVVEGTVPPTSSETESESIDVGEYVFNENSNFSSDDTRFGANRPYNLRRDDHLALARDFSVYNALQPINEQPTASVITYFPLSHYEDPNLAIRASMFDTDSERVNEDQSLNDSLNDPFSDTNSTRNNSEDLNNDRHLNEYLMEQSFNSNYDYQHDESHHSLEEFVNSDRLTDISTDRNASFNSSQSTTSSASLPQPRTSSPIRNRELADLGPILPYNRRRIVPLTLHRREIDGNLHQSFGYDDD